MRALMMASALWMVAACSPTDGWYESCDSADACVGGTECVTVAFETGRDGAMCTATCVAHADCPYGGACYELVGDPMAGQRVCYARCIDDRDCAPGLICAEAAMGAEVVDGICLPE